MKRHITFVLNFFQETADAKPPAGQCRIGTRSRINRFLPSRSVREPVS